MPTRFVIYLLIRQIVIFQTLFALTFPVEHYLKSGRTRSFSGPYFPAFGLNTEKCSRKTRKTPNTDTFHAVEMCNIT